MNYNSYRRKTRVVHCGRVAIGGDNPVAVQSMTNTDTNNFEKTYEQIKALENAGCDIVRLAVPTVGAAKIFYELKNAGVKIPLVADIHFDYRIALESIAAGCDKIRINPGNIGEKEKVKSVCDACRNAGIPIRIGVNSGSLQKDILEKYSSPTPEALTESALYYIDLLHSFDFGDIVLAVKSSNPAFMIKTNRLLAQKTDCPIHLGVTEAGTEYMGTVKSSVGIGSLLADGIGDTIRVSLTTDPVREVIAGRSILASLGMIFIGGINIVSCPTCGRTKLDLIGIANELQKRALNGETHPSKPLTVAVMGCAVNGPGEAREADLGIAGAVGEAVIFSHGEITGRVKEAQAVDRLIEMINSL